MPQQTRPFIVQPPPGAAQAEPLWRRYGIGSPGDCVTPKLEYQPR